MENGDDSNWKKEFNVVYFPSGYERKISELDGGGDFTKRTAAEGCKSSAAVWNNT
jgi:hypothetical protein